MLILSLHLFKQSRSLYYYRLFGILLLYPMIP